MPNVASLSVDESRSVTRPTCELTLGWGRLHKNPSMSDVGLELTTSRLYADSFSHYATAAGFDISYLLYFKQLFLRCVQCSHSK